MDPRLEARFCVSGRIGVETRDAATGSLIPEESGWSDNIVVDVGLAQLAALLNQEADTTGFEIGVGTSNTAPAAGNTDLGTRVYRAGITQKSRSGAVVTYKLYVDSTSANGYTLLEAGLFHNGVLIDRALITSVAKTSAKTVTITVVLTLSR